MPCGSRRELPRCPGSAPERRSVVPKSEPWQKAVFERTSGGYGAPALPWTIPQSKFLLRAAPKAHPLPSARPTGGRFPKRLRSTSRGKRVFGGAGLRLGHGRPGLLRWRPRCRRWTEQPPCSRPGMHRMLITEKLAQTCDQWPHPNGELRQAMCVCVSTMLWPCVLRRATGERHFAQLTGTTRHVQKHMLRVNAVRYFGILGHLVLTSALERWCFRCGRPPGIACSCGPMLHKGKARFVGGEVGVREVRCASETPGGALLWTCRCATWRWRSWCRWCREGWWPSRGWRCRGSPGTPATGSPSWSWGADARARPQGGERNHNDGSHAKLPTAHSKGITSFSRPGRPQAVCEMHPKLAELGPHSIDTNPNSVDSGPTWGPSPAKVAARLAELGPNPAGIG